MICVEKRTNPHNLWKYPTADGVYHDNDDLDVVVDDVYDDLYDDIYDDVDDDNSEAVSDSGGWKQPIGEKGVGASDPDIQTHISHSFMMMMMMMMIMMMTMMMMNL